MTSEEISKYMSMIGKKGAAAQTSEMRRQAALKREANKRAKKLDEKPGEYEDL